MMDSITQKDIDLANFAKAIALPVRVGIIRLILETKNNATRLQLHELPYKQAVINQHLAELLYLKILKSKRDGRMNSYMVDEECFARMSNHFLNLFQSLGFKNDDIKPLKKTAKPKLAPLTFGKYIQTCRKNAGMTQAKFAGLVDLHRTYLSRIEQGTHIIAPSKLPVLAKVLGVDFGVLNQYYAKGKLSAIEQKVSSYAPVLFNSVNK